MDFHEPGCLAGRKRFDEMGLGFTGKPDDDVRPAWLVHDGRAEGVEAAAKQLAAFGHRAAAKVRSASNHSPGRLSLGVGVDDLNASGGGLMVDG